MTAVEQLHVMRLAVEQALTLAALFPEWVRGADVSCDPDNEVALDWYGSGRSLTIAINANGRISYAWIGGGHEGRGQEQFDGEAIPEKVLAAIEVVRESR